MSASSTPTRSPLARNPSARLAATVDLPTPPLPDATATIAPTPGTAPRAVRTPAGPPAGPGRRRGRAAARRRLRRQHRGHRKHAGQRLDGLLGCLPQRFETRAALALDLDREGDIAVANDETRYHAERDDVGALVGIGDAAQRVEDLSFGDGTHFILLARRAGRSRVIDRGAWFGAPDEADWRSSKPVAGSREDAVRSLVTGHERRRICGIWDRRPDLTTPAHALYRVAHLARRNQWGPARPKAAQAIFPGRFSRGDFPVRPGWHPKRRHRGKVQGRCSGKVRAVAVPWGSGPRGGGPWGGNRGGGGPGPRGRGPQPPDFEELLRRGQDRFRRVLPGGFRTGTGIAIVVLGILVIWLASGFYRVLPDEVGVVLRFGAYNRTTQPGLNYHLPSPIEKVAHAERDPRQPDRDRLSQRRGPGPRPGHAPSAGRGADADRRREHRRHQLHRLLGDQGRPGLSVQHPGPGGDGQIRRRERDARGGRRDPDRPGAVGRARQDRDRYAAPAAGHPRRLWRRDRSSLSCSC